MDVIGSMARATYRLRELAGAAGLSRRRRRARPTRALDAGLRRLTDGAAGEPVG